MSFRLNEPADGISAGEPEDPIRRWVRLLQHGAPAERQKAARQLVRKRAEEALVECLQASDPYTVSLATSGLWECWLNERGRNARREIDRGTSLMEVGEYAAAEECFLNLMAEFPDWAEAKNKQATLLYLRGQPAVSMALCQEVVRLKPYHFGAWNGLALCAAQLGDWRRVVSAATRALRLQPASEANQHLLDLGRQKMQEAGMDEASDD